MSEGQQDELVKLLLLVLGKAVERDEECNTGGWEG